MGGPLGLLAGFIGLVGLAVMIANRHTTLIDPVGVALFALFTLNGLVVLYRRMTGRESTSRAKGPFTRKK